MTVGCFPVLQIVGVDNPSTIKINVSQNRDFKHPLMIDGVKVENYSPVSKASFGNYGLLEAMGKGHFDIAAKLLNVDGSSGDTPSLLESIGGINATGVEGYTMLHHIANNAAAPADLIDFIYSNSELDWNAKTRDGKTALGLAAKAGHGSAFVQQLLDHDLDPLFSIT